MFSVSEINSIIFHHVTEGESKTGSFKFIGSSETVHLFIGFVVMPKWRRTRRRKEVRLTTGKDGRPDGRKLTRPLSLK